MATGLTDADRERIREYLERPPHRRRPDLLCPDDDEDDLPVDYGWVDCFPGVDRERLVPDARTEVSDVRDAGRPGTGEELACPRCEEAVPLRAENCPHCELALL